MKRKMTAIMVGDVVGYSGMMERAEEQTADRLASCQALIAIALSIHFESAPGDAGTPRGRAQESKLPCKITVMEACQQAASSRQPRLPRPEDPAA